MPCAVSDIFDIRYGHSLELNALEISTAKDGVAFVSRQTGDNGISAYVSAIENVVPAEAGEITCALSGNGVLTTCLQEIPFYTGFHVAILHPKLDLTKQQILFYCLCIKSNRYRFNYGRQANKTLQNLLIPHVENIPEWVNLTDLSPYADAKKPFSIKPPVSLNTATWTEYKFSVLFDIKKGKRLTQEDMLPGEVPFVGAIDHDNGVSHLVGQEAIFKENTITVNYDGNGVAEAYYQSRPYWALDSVNVLYPKFYLTPYIAMFLCALIRKEKFRYNYGRKWHLERMQESTIRLPSTLGGSPDFEFMENYIKSLPYSKSI